VSLVPSVLSLKEVGRKVEADLCLLFLPSPLPPPNGSASSTGLLLKTTGLKVTSIKIDPYMNIDAGTMAPTEHGEFSSSSPKTREVEQEGCRLRGPLELGRGREPGYGRYRSLDDPEGEGGPWESLFGREGRRGRRKEEVELGN